MPAGKTPVTIEIPTAEVQRVINGLCKGAGLPATAGNAKQVAKEIVEQRVHEQESRESDEAGSKATREAEAKLLPLEGLE